MTTAHPGPMTETTVKVSRAVPVMIGALDELIAAVCGERVLFMFFAFTDGRSSYASNVLDKEEYDQLMRNFHRWLDNMERQLRGDEVNFADAPVANEVSIALATHMRDIAKEVSNVVDEIAGEHVLIALIAFPQGVGQYASNADRADVVKSLREWLDYKDAGMEDVPAHNFM